MPAVQYPFIDIAVHERVKDHFARGEAIVLFSLDLTDVLWANGAGAGLFGKPVIYDLIEDGPNRNDVTFRQVETTAQQLRSSGEVRRFLIRIPAGFQRVAVEAVVERIHLTRDVDALLFAAPVSKAPLKDEVIARSMLEGFDDPDTHMAVLGEDGLILSASPGFLELGMTPATARTLVGMAASHPDRLVKRPIPTGKGYLPAAIGRVSNEPPMHLLFAVETILGTMGADPGFPLAEEPAVAEAVQTVAPLVETVEPDVEPETPAPDLFAQLPAEVTPPVEPVEVQATTLPAEPETLEPETRDPEQAEPEVLEADDERTAYESVEAEVDATAATGNGTEGRDVETADLVPVEDDADVEADEEPVAPADVAVVAEPVEAHIPDEAAAPAEAEPAPAVEDGFSFNRSARPTRFVWKIDADGNFSEVSPELAAAVGPHAASLPGTAFGDIASLLSLDPEGKILELLGRRDTWSGKTIYWPIEGTALKAPVDLAALPTYKRNREFDGFRGFGIVRLSDAVDDPESIGLTLSGETGRNYQDEPVLDAEEPDDMQVAYQDIDGSEASETVAAEPVETETAVTFDEAEVSVLADEPVSTGADLPPEVEADQSEPVTDETEHAVVEEPAASPPPRQEPPVLRIVEPPQVAETEKVIRLEERRQRGRDGLTPGEQEAFREIARQLEPFRRDITDETVAEGNVSDVHDQTAEAAPEAAEVSEPPVTAANDAEPPAASISAGGTDKDADEPPAADETEAAVPEDETTADPEPAKPLDPPSTVSESEQLEILAASIPARTALTGALTSEAIDEIPVALLIHAGDRLIHANPEFLRLSGYASLSDLQDVGGLDSLLHHKDLADMPEQSGGLSLVRADDTLIPVTARLQSIRWAESNALLLALIPSGQRAPVAVPEAPEMTDAEEERLNGRVNALQVEVEELRSILETATDGVVIIGPEGDIRSMNRSASALFDYDDAETKGKPFVMLFAHESHRAVADYLAGMTGHGVASVLNDGREVIGREAAGGFIPLFMTIGKLSVSNGFCAVIRDITQWKRSEEDLKSAKRAAETANAHKSDFLARVSHEIRTPLNAIIGFSDMMAIEHFGPIGHPRYVEYANDIARSGRLVLDIVNDLLDISKIEAGEMDLEFTAVGLNDAVSEAVSLVQPQAHNQRVIIRTAFSDAVPDVVADLRSIKQIVLNILANAIRFTQAGGQIVVSTSYETNGSVVLRVRDTGVGMTRAELEQAMKPFRQVTAGTRKRGDGTGLGLPLTKAMVDANRAGFTIQSAPNEGTLVEITFPSPRVLAN